jgi:hypothetical protein
MGFQDIYRFWSAQYVFSANSGKNARVLIVTSQKLRATVDFSNFMIDHCKLRKRRGIDFLTINQRLWSNFSMVNVSAEPIG